MINNVLHETILIENLYEEYIRHVNRYQNLNRRSIFVRYLNINKAASTYNHDLDSSFDRYNSGIQYDIYDYTPLFLSSQVINDASNQIDMIGQQFSGPLNVTIYTIEEPRIEDLLIFNRPPQKGLEIFRVDQVRSALNAMQSTPSANWFELTLEYAPIIDISKLNFLNHYAYSLTLQKNIFAKEFERQIKENEHLVELFTTFEENHFNPQSELYSITVGEHKLAPIYENRVIYNFLSLKSEYEDHFHHFARPYGVNYFDNTNICYNLNTKEMVSYVPNDINFVDRILDQSSPVNIYEIAHLISLWIWDRNREHYRQIIPSNPRNIPDLSHSEGLNAISKYDTKFGVLVDANKIENFEG